MTSTTSAPDEPGFTPDTSGSTLPDAPTYEIAPEDREIAERLSNFDPVDAVPSPATRKGGSQKPMAGPLNRKMLPPAMQQEIEQKLHDVLPNLREKRESELVYEALRRNALEYRIKAGPGEGANEFVKERFLIANERHQSEKEIMRLASELAQVDRWVPVFNEVTGEPVIDPKTGQQQVKAIEVVQGERRTAMQNRISELNHKIALLEGPEADIRERKALWKAVEAEKAKAAQLSEDQEARAKGEDIARQERIDAKAEAYAKSKRWQS